MKQKTFTIDNKEAVNPIYVKIIREDLPITNGHDPQKQIIEEHNNYYINITEKIKEMLLQNSKNHSLYRILTSPLLEEEMTNAMMKRIKFPSKNAFFSPRPRRASFLL